MKPEAMGTILKWIGGAATIGLAVVTYNYAIAPRPMSRDPDYRIVYDLMRVIYMDGDCSHLTTHFSTYFVPGLATCSGGGVEGPLRIENLENGTVLVLKRRIDLRVCLDSDGNRLIVDQANLYAFWVQNGVILGFRSVSPEELLNLNCS